MVKRGCREFGLATLQGWQAVPGHEELVTWRKGQGDVGVRERQIMLRPVTHA